MNNPLSTSDIKTNNVTMMGIFVKRLSFFSQISRQMARVLRRLQKKKASASHSPLYGLEQ